MNTDILIIGGGVIGLSIARELHKRGAGKIAILDKGRIGGEASWAAAGMLAPNAETHAEDPFFHFCTESNALYPQFAADLLDETGIDIELDRTGTLYLGFNEADADEIAAKHEWQSRAGIAVERFSREDVFKLEPHASPHIKTALFYANDWQVENRKLVGALRRYCELNGVELIEDTEVTELIVENEVTLGARTKTAEFRADWIVIASGAWTTTLTAHQLPSVEKVRPIRGQMICLEGGPRIINSVVYSPRGYIVPRKDGRILVGATVEDIGFDKAVTPDAISDLRAAALEIAPVLTDFDIKEAWAGLRPLAGEGFPVIGAIPDCRNAFIATGHYRNGILLAPITARILADAVVSSADSVRSVSSVV